MNDNELPLGGLVHQDVSGGAVHNLSLIEPGFVEHPFSNSTSRPQGYEDRVGHHPFPVENKNRFEGRESDNEVPPSIDHVQALWTEMAG